MILRPVTARLSGSILCPEGVSSADRWVGFWPGSIPEDTGPALLELQTTRTDALGRFQLDLPEEGTGAFFVVVPGLGIYNEIIDSNGEHKRDLGAIPIDPGASITGTAYFSDRPVDAGVEIIATPDSSQSDRLFRRHGVHTFKGQVLFARITARTNDSGMFHLKGLTPGVDYRVAMANPSLDGRAFSYDPLRNEGRVHKASARDIHLTAEKTQAQLFVHERGTAIPTARVQFAFPSGYKADPNSKDSQARYRRFRSLDSEGRLALAIPSNGALNLEVTAPGYVPHPLRLTPSMLDRQGNVTIEMTPAPPGTPGSVSVQVEVELTGFGVESLEGCEILMQLFDRNNGTVPVPSARVQGGKVRFTDIPQGRYTFALRTISDPKVLPGELPFVRTRFTTHHNLKPEELPADGVLRLQHEVELGGRIELHVEGYDGTPSPAEFELVNFSGYARRPRILQDNGLEEGHRVTTQCVGPGPFWLDSFIEAGPWTLRQVGADYAESEVAVPLELGQNMTLTFRLKPR